jgi:tetratricopeptide (TPR) repeat protein
MADKLTDLAAALGSPGAVDERTIRRWEEGERQPWPRNIRLLSLLLGQSADDLGLISRPPEASLTDELASVASAKVTSGLAGGRVDHEVLRWIRERTEHLWHLDDLLGGDSCLGLADSDLRLVLGLLRRGRYDEATEHRLYGTAAELARFAGWAAFDADRHGDARSYWRAGLLSAQAAEDPDLHAYLLSNLALQAIYAGDGQTAVDLLETARARIGKESSVTVRAMLDAWQVRAHAELREPRKASHLLNRADDLWDRRVVSEDPPWIYWMTRPSLTAEAGRAFLTLSQPKQAEELLTQGLHMLGDDSQRDRLLYLTNIAEARLDQRGGQDGALETAAEAVELATNVDSSRVIDQITAFAHRLQPNGPPVREFRKRVEALRSNS